jgi:hypothetical protein
VCKTPRGLDVAASFLVVLFNGKGRREEMMKKKRRRKMRELLCLAY